MKKHETKLLRWLWLALCLTAITLFGCSEALALGERFQKALKRELMFIIREKPKYRWGGSSELDQGLDCSGYIYLACVRAGVPGVTRCVSSRMAMGVGGWKSKPARVTDLRACDLLFWTFSPTRRNGHVGVYLPRGTTPMATHASKTQGVIHTPLTETLLVKLSTIRRLTIGDENAH